MSSFWTRCGKLNKCGRIQCHVGKSCTSLSPEDQFILSSSCPFNPIQQQDVKEFSCKIAYSLDPEYDPWPENKLILKECTLVVLDFLLRALWIHNCWTLDKRWQMISPKGLTTAPGWNPKQTVVKWSQQSLLPEVQIHPCCLLCCPLYPL
jgi:hypothetical protein